MPQQITIAGRIIGRDHPPYCVAELSANHNGILERALATIEAAKSAGADAVKLQTYTPDSMTLDLDEPDFVIEGGLWHGRRLFDLYREAETPGVWHPALFERARSLDLPIFSSPFDADAIALLESLGAPAYKIASFELIDHALVAAAARTGKPLIISTGMASPAEIAETVQVARQAGASDVLLLHCVSGYPTPVDAINLRRIPELAAEMDLPVGLSDHTLGTEVAIAAVALGACFIEKHFTMARADGGPDAAFSLEPDEFAGMASGARTAFRALGAGGPARPAMESASLAFRRSIYVSRDILAGEPFTAENLRVIRPGHGLAPKHLPEVIGRAAARDLKRGARLTWAEVA